MQKRRVIFIDIPGQKGYLPLAAGYLAATALADERVADAFDVRMLFPDVTSNVRQIVEEIASDVEPALIAMSIQGWALPFADLLGAALHERIPDCPIIFGGNHVSGRAAEVMASRPFLKATASGEGEFVFRDLLLEMIDAPATKAFLRVAGLACITPEGALHDAGKCDRIVDLDSIPSPYLTGVFAPYLHGANTVLLETNRGCPYRCSFCFWGAATNSKVRIFEIERVKAEMLMLADAGIESWYICDANFGILKRDAELVDYMVQLKAQYNYPSVVHTNWAKNSNERVVSLAARLASAGIHSTYTIAAQSTDLQTLEYANRKNMSINSIKELAELCRQHNVIPRGELIFGLPGESYETFLKSYNELVEHTDALSVYPHYILPNTHYEENRELYGIQTQKLEIDTDYEYCIGHNEMSRDEFDVGMRFVVANNILKVAGNVFVVYARVVAQTTGLSQARLVEAFGQWVLTSHDPVARQLAPFLRNPAETHRYMLTRVWDLIRSSRNQFLRMIQSFASEHVNLSVDEGDRALLEDALRYDLALFPLVAPSPDIEMSEAGYAAYYEFAYDFLAYQSGHATAPPKRMSRYRIEYRVGLERYPTDKWYFGLISFRGRAVRADLCESEPASTATLRIAG